MPGRTATPDVIHHKLLRQASRISQDGWRGAAIELTSESVGRLPGHHIGVFVGLGINTSDLTCAAPRQ